MHSQKVEYVQFRADKIIVYDQYLQANLNTRSSCCIHHPATNSKYQGKFTKSSQKLLLKALYTISQITPIKRQLNITNMQFYPFKLSLLTLTLSASYDQHQNNQITSNLLVPFLKICVNKFGMRNYVWRLEFQQNGNIHYHIVSDMYYPHDKLKDTWNALQRKYGLTDNYFKVHGHHNPNSIDIHSIDINDRSFNYLAKYTSKDECKYELKSGRYWDASTSVKGFKYFTLSEHDQQFRELTEFILSANFEIFRGDRFTVYKPTTGHYLDYAPKLLAEQIKQHYNSR